VNNNNDPYYILSDHLSSSSILTDSTGTTAQLSDYKPFGNINYDNEIIDLKNDYKFTGREYDEETNIQYFGARYYDNQLGRFTAIDPLMIDILDAKKYNKNTDEILANPQELNSYSYVANNPVVYVDPTGAIKVNYDDATDEQKTQFKEALVKLHDLVQNNQEIQDYFKSFDKDIDIVKILSSDEKYGPDVFIGVDDNPDKPLAGSYNGDWWFNDVNIYDLGLEGDSESIGSTLIHELSHWANDAGSWFGDKNPNISGFKSYEHFMSQQNSKDQGLSGYEKQQRFNTYYKVMSDWGGPYGYFAEDILYGKY